MLVLSRKQNQEIIIGDDIKITVLKVRGNMVRLGIDAPKQVRVVRGELPRRDTVQDDTAKNVTIEFRSDPNSVQDSANQLRVIHTGNSHELPSDQQDDSTADSPAGLLQQLVTKRKNASVDAVQGDQTRAGREAGDIQGQQIDLTF